MLVSWPRALASRSWRARRRGTAALSALAGALLAGAAIPSTAALAQGAGHGHGHRAVARPRTPLRSPSLWATINVCTHASKPTIGVRGSMPPDGSGKAAKDIMFMRFKVQYEQGAGGWRDLPSGAASNLIEVGPATRTRQAGRTFQLAPVPPHESFVLRGLVEFEWRTDGKTILSAVRSTTAAHRSLAGASPKGFSAATCTVSG